MARDIGSGVYRDAVAVKAQHRQSDEKRMASGASPAQISAENALIKPAAARQAQIVRIGSRFSVAALAGR